MRSDFPWHPSVSFFHRLCRYCCMDWSRLRRWQSATWFHFPHLPLCLPPRYWLPWLPPPSPTLRIYPLPALHRPGPHQQLLGRLPRRPAPLRRVPAGTGRRPQLDPALGAADPAGRGRPQRRRRAGRLAAHAGSQAGRRVAAAGLGRRRGGARWPQKLPVQEPSMVAAQLMPANRANSSIPVMVANPAIQRTSSPTRSSMSPPFRVGRRSGGGWRSRCCRGGRTWW